MFFFPQLHPDNEDRINIVIRHFRQVAFGVTLSIVSLYARGESNLKTKAGANPALTDILTREGGVETDLYQ